MNIGPDGKDAAIRFKQQQAEWASTDTTQPSSELGASILLSIPIDPAPYDEAVAQIHPTTFADLQWKGNLLLGAGRAKEARDVFEQAILVAGSKQTAPAVENVARAIRAESGCVGPANAYIIKMRSAGQKQ